jgi:hypothetical protein
VKPDDTIPYATPTATPGRIGRWLARRGATAGPRLIALAIVMFVGVTAMSPSQTNIILYNAGDTVVRVSLILFVIEYALSFFH